MTRRVLDVEIRSEFKKGFGDIAKSFSALEKQLRNVSKLTESINKLSATMDRSMSMTKAQQGLKNTAAAQTKVNKAVENGVRVAKQHESAYTKLGRGLSAVTTAQRAGSISAKQRLEAEIGLLNTYIKRTKDLSVLENKKVSVRDSKGKFATFSADAKQAVKAMLPAPAEVKPVVQRLTREVQKQINDAIADSNNRANAGSRKKSDSFFSRMFGTNSATLSGQDRNQLTSMYRGMFAEIDKATAASVVTGSKRGGNIAVAQMKATAGRIKQATAQLTASGYQPSFDSRSQQAGFYDAVWGSQGRKSGAGMGTQALINQNTGVKNAGNTGLMMGDDTKFNQLKLQYLSQQEKALGRVQTKAATVAGAIRGMSFAPNPAKNEAVINKMINSYTRLGHVLFQLQYSTLTFFGATGIGMMTAQIDKFITLRNQIARTSDSINDLGANMKDVYGISMRTFSDANVVGNMYSRINKYSKTLGLDQKEVGGVTEAIAGAFAASPGNAQEKSASMYQFMQGFQSNRMGGDELRSVLEMAPFVGDILGKGLAKRRGMPEGSVVDLRKQGELGTPVNTRDLAAIFNDPATQAEIRKVLGEQARTFGDLLQVGKTRLMMMTEAMMNGTGVISVFINTIASFLADDEKFKKFTDALTTATVALVTYGAAITARGAVGMAGSALQGAGARLGFGMSNVMSGAVPLAGAGYGPMKPQRMSNAAVNGMYAAANRENIGRTLSGVGKAGSAVGAGAANVLLGLGTALNAVQKPGLLAKNAMTGLSGAATKVGTSTGKLASGLASTAAQGQLGSKIMAGMGATLGRLGPILLSVIGFFTTLSIPLIVIASVIALLVVRFNSLLGGMTGGMNVMDILKGTWVMLTDAMSKLASYIQDSFVGKIFGAFTGFIDNILKFLGKAAAGNEVFQAMQANRQLDKNGDGSAVMYENGKAFFTRVDAQGGIHSTGKEAKNADGSWMRADFNAGDRNVVRNQPNLPSGYKSNLPEASGPKTPTGSKGPKDPWPEFIRDLRLKIQEVSDGIDLTPLMRDVQGDLNQNFRKAMDVMNFDAQGFSTLTDAWTAFSASNAAKAAEVNELNIRLKKEKLAEKFNEFMDSLQELFADSRLGSMKAGMSGLRGSQVDSQVELIKKFMNDSDQFGGNRDEQVAIRQFLADGNISGAERRLKANLQNGTGESYDDAKARLQKDNIDTIVNGKKRENALAREALANQAMALGLFGNARVVQEEINTLTQSYAEQYGTAAERGALINAQLAQEIELVRQRNQMQLEYNDSWQNGLRDSLANYRDEIANFAGEVGSAFTNSLKGLEDGLTNLITTGKMDLHGFITQIQADVAKLFVRQMIMKPLTNWMDKMFGDVFGEQDKTINAENVYINGSGLGSMFGGEGKGGNILDSLFGGNGGPVGEQGSWLQNLIGNIGGGQAAGGKAGGGWMGKIAGMASNFLPPPFNMIGKLFSMFHGGGTVGASTMSRVINPSVFAGARRYHTGGTVGMPSLAVGEVPAILQQGEKVLTASQYSAMNSGGSSTTFSPAISINYTAGNGEQSGNGGETDAKTLSKMVQGAVNEALVEYDMKSRRPGNPAYLANRRR